MSAPQIPNLNTLRRGGGRGGRGRGGGGGSPGEAAPTGPGHSPNHETVSQADKDKIIQGTDLDAATSRLSAVECGYLADPYAKFMVPGGHADRRLPLMNRGTWARTTAIDLLVDKFISSRNTTPPPPPTSSPSPSTSTSSSRRRQIISLGAGSDTRFLRLRQKYATSIPPSDLLYHEIDFAANTRAKATQLEHAGLSALLAEQLHGSTNFLFRETDPSGNTLTSPGAEGYFLHCHDLRHLPLRAEALRCIERDVPTLLISECCLVYLAPAEAEAVLEYFGGLFPAATPVGVVIYEPIRPHDAFGRTMVANLTARGIRLQTVEANATLGLQRERLRRVGFGASTAQGQGQGQAHDREGRVGESEAAVVHSEAVGGSGGGGVGAVDLDFMWSTWVDEKEKERVTELEWMDEMEEWVLLMKHYCVAWGWRDGSGGQQSSDGGRGAFGGWNEVESQNSRD